MAEGRGWTANGEDQGVSNNGGHGGPPYMAEAEGIIVGSATVPT